MFRDYLKLHFIVILAGFTAILGDLITLGGAALVFWRTLVAGAVLIVFLTFKKTGPRPSLRDRSLLFANGLLIGLHWYLFFHAVKIANVSVCMVGMATVALWTSILEPLILQRRRPSLYEVALGLVMIAAIAFLFGSGSPFKAGLAVAVGSALAATLFAIFNGFFTNKHHFLVITSHEMAGACVFNAGAFLVFDHLAGGTLTFLPTLADTGWLLVLSLACTVYAFSQYVELLRRLSVFTINLSFNLEPVYGITLAALIFGEHHQLTAQFYIASAVILAAVLSYPFAQRRASRVG